jgi:hypothetical protein
MPPEKRFELPTICPSLIWGLTFHPEKFWAANELIEYFNGQLKLSDKSIAIVDIRDVCEMHLQTLLRQDAGNHRFIAYSESLSVTDVAAILQ